MSILDDDGNLFGIVNVIDALVVLLVFAVVIAGVALIALPSGEPDTRHATVELGPQPDHVLNSLSPGDRTSINGQNVTVTDTYGTPTTDEEDGTTLIIRVEIEGQMVETEDGESRFEFGGETLRSGDEITLETNEYVVDGQLSSLERDGSELNVETTPALVESTVSTSKADEISEGDTFSAGPYTMATIEDVQQYPVGDDTHRVQVGVSLETIQTGSTPRFAGEPVRVGSNIEVSFDSYSMDGEIIRRGTTSLVGEFESTTTELKLENIDPDAAASLSEGMTETVRGETLATVQTVDTQPAEVVLESEDGNIHSREHPKNKDVRLTVELQTLNTSSGIKFHGESVREGDTITLDFGSVEIQGTVTRLQAS